MAPPLFWSSTIGDESRRRRFAGWQVITKPSRERGPTLSQAWGQVIHAAVADHLDVLGHFGDAEHDPPHVDWLVSGSHFNRRRFEALWADVARFLVPDAAHQPKRGRAAGRPRAKKATSRKKARQR